MSQALPQTDIASVTWSDGHGNTQIRTYFQDIKFGIRESRYDGKSWSGGTAQDVINTFEGAKPAKPSSPIAAFSHQEDIHVYYISNDDIIQEITGSGWGNDWKISPVSLSKLNFKAYPLSRLAALPYGGGIDCSVFYQNTQGLIGHLRRIDEKVDGNFVSWKEVEPFGSKAAYGTGLTAVHPDPYDGSAKIRVYYQQSNNILADFAVEDSGSFQQGALGQLDPPPGALTNTGIAAVSNKLFYLGTTNWFTSGSYYTSRQQWVIGADHPDHIRVHPSSGIAVVLDPNALHRAYVQDDTNQILELSFKEPWVDGSRTVVPTGNAQ